jgi:hypothetical protein
LISRRLGGKPRVFGAFLTCKGVDFSPVTKILPDYFVLLKLRDGGHGFQLQGSMRQTDWDQEQTKD